MDVSTTCRCIRDKVMLLGKEGKAARTVVTERLSAGDRFWLDNRPGSMDRPAEAAFKCVESSHVVGNSIRQAALGIIAN